MKSDASYDRKQKNLDAHAIGVQGDLMKAALQQQSVTEDDLVREEKE